MYISSHTNTGILTQNVCELELGHRKKGRWKGQAGSKTPYALSLPLPPRTTAG
jgi:hypothetical protein